MDFNSLRPEMFILPPYEPCPFCGEGDYGVSDIEGRTCERTYRRCRYHEGSTLPPITKKLLYLDQFAITNILHTYRPESRRNLNRATDPVGREVAERVFRLGAWQVIACPPTLIHQRESILDDRLFAPLQRIYNFVGFGVSVLSQHRVHTVQFRRGFAKFLAGDDTSVDTPPEDVAWGLHDWIKRWRVLPQIEDDASVAAKFRENKTTLARDINELFGRWAQEAAIGFEQRVAMEASAPGEIYGWGINTFLKANPEAALLIGATGRIPQGVTPDMLGFQAIWTRERCLATFSVGERIVEREVQYPTGTSARAERGRGFRCELHVCGPGSRVEAYLRTSSLPTWEILPGGVDPFHQTHLLIRVAETESLAEQSREASSFLHAHRDDLARLRALPEIESLSLDFYVRAEGAHYPLPLELVEAAFSLEISLNVGTPPAADVS